MAGKCLLLARQLVLAYSATVHEKGVASRMAAPLTALLKSLVVVWIAISIGCGDPEVGESSVSLIENVPPYPTWTIDSSSVLRIGTALERPHEQHFSDVRFAATLSNGQVLVVDGGSSEVRWFEGDGSLKDRAGGPGAGPGELGYVKSGAILAGDTLVLFDSKNQRLTWFDSHGRLARSSRVFLGMTLGVSLDRVAKGDLLIIAESPTQNFGGREYNYTQDSVFAIRVSTESGADTVIALPGREAVTWVDYVDGIPRGTRQMDLPFGEATLVAGLDSAVVVVPSGGADIVFYNLSGEPFHSASRTDARATAVTPALRRRYISGATERAMSAGAPPSLARAGAEETLELLPEGRNLPLHDRMLIDHVGERIWLRDYVPLWRENDSQNWTVHDSRGRVLARVSTPARFELMHVAQSRLTGRIQDALGVEYVTKYELSVPAQ